ncbi:hypothetical protein ACFWIB_21890 [Streptomyces sp. NPDC127051]|uniref:hypothetical protein n=1 Tax=Streptomyces sp. NPDC127051 TaxID=3347119 RepID=UPI003648FE3A
MPRQVWRWGVAGWAALVLAGGAYTLYLDDSPGATSEPKRWERAPSPSDEPVPCPTLSGAVAPTTHSCTYWQRD